MAGSILPDGVLRDLACQVGGLPPKCGARAHVRLRPAATAERGDLSTDAALFCAHAARLPVQALAQSLAQALRQLPVVRDATATLSGHINLALAETSLPDVVGLLLQAPPPAPDPMVLVVPIAAMRRQDWMFKVQYAHARCRSLARAADPAELQESMDWSMLLAGEPRRLLCWLDHWWRIADLAPSLVPGLALGLAPGLAQGSFQGASVERYLVQVSDQFDRVWKHPADGAKLRALHAGQPNRSAPLSLALATACVIRAGLGVLGVAAAEEIR